MCLKCVYHSFITPAPESIRQLIEKFFFIFLRKLYSKESTDIKIIEIDTEIWLLNRNLVVILCFRKRCKSFAPKNSRLVIFKFRHGFKKFSVKKQVIMKHTIHLAYKEKNLL